jgi:hypothetical protein
MSDAIAAAPRTCGEEPVARQMARCAWTVLGLLRRRRLHLCPDEVGSVVPLPDGRRFVVYRHTTRDGSDDARGVTLAVWFRLRGVPPGAWFRRWLFERESILNTLLYAGVEGYRVKLWMVNPVSSDYAGLYEWRGAASAERYARYITAVLRPLSVPGTVGYELLPATSLGGYLSTARGTT